ncbi:MAG: hypothetical protein QXR58_00505 [Candidatus Micrarchaeaceae archaeon]
MRVGFEIRSLASGIKGLDAFNIVSAAVMSVGSIILLSKLFGGYLLLIASLIALSLFAFLIYLELFFAEKRSASNASRSMLRLLYRIKSGMSLAGMPFHSCIARESKSGAHGQIASALIEIRNRMSFGQDFYEAVQSTAFDSAEPRRAFGSLSEAYRHSMDMFLAVKHAYNSMLKDRLEKIERSSLSLQKYSSVSMVTGAIVPSFMLFAFIGYSIMKGGPMPLFAFAVLFSIVLPYVFLSIRMIQAGLYEI